MGRRVASAVGVAAVVIPVFRVRRPRRWTLCEPPDRMVAGSSCADDLGDCHAIFNRGVDADQTVFHLHGHVVPRRAGDGLRMPWN